MSAPLLYDHRRELACRVSGDLEVTLYWDSGANSTTVEVWQHASGETLAFAVPCERALDAFYHPFAHVPTAFDELPLNTHGNVR